MEVNTLIAEVLATASTAVADSLPYPRMNKPVRTTLDPLIGTVE